MQFACAICIQVSAFFGAIHYQSEDFPRYLFFYPEKLLTQYSITNIELRLTV